ncbi:hypothetical protein [Marinifilum caeruleilacunae]|uniref:Tetratricopeptide repeat protein n=1 Tax=Marinifilum caeruleilacunae TaxID=2499076 RepID=A0ABX1WZ35_9BACT|nr:hypothetical protein [Marinifilum caeruleilacunae]NOU61413.1 hypothetical protein [Marinifilum caeruleilacunae]
MYQKDYILRMIELIAELIAQILGLLTKNNTQEASKILENAYRDFLKEDAAFFRNIPKEKLNTTLLEQHNYTNEHLQILAELFYAEAEIQTAKNQLELSQEFYQKSMVLFQFVDENAVSFSIHLQKRINLIKSKLQN